MRCLAVGDTESPLAGSVQVREAGLRRAERGALLPTPARRSRLPSSKFLGQAETPDGPAGEGGRREELGAALSPLVPGPEPQAHSLPGSNLESGVPGCLGD